MGEASTKFEERIGELIPEAEAGYGPQATRAEVDRLLREHVAGAIESLRAKVGELKGAAEEEGEEDMMDDLERLDSRMGRTAAALRDADYSGTPFLDSGELPEPHLDRVCAYDAEILDDLDLLVRDITVLKYETIGTLTLREVEGTLAAIELKIANRKDIFEHTGSD